MTNVISKVREGLATVTLNRPDVLNALSPEMAHDLQQALSGISRDEHVRCVVLKGAGKGFMAGGDIGFFKRALPELQAGRVEGMNAIFEHVHGIVEALRSIPVPVIGVLHGAVAGFGVSLAAACDMTVAEEQTRFTLAYCHIGTSPDGASSYMLPRVVGLKKAMELTLLGDRFDAREALALGLVNKVVPETEIQAAVDAWVERFLAGPRFAYGRTKALLYSSLDNSFEEQIKLEEQYFKQCASTADFAEGVTAFTEKRKARFR
jgi:2-(1,2-epoxy-1,2-dihydrophenyl)acetyl-CoA isomerase